MKTRFQIVEIYPVYCQITDGLIGSKARCLPNAYETEALAHKIAGRLHQADYEGCGDSSFRVVEYGESPFSSPRFLPTTDDFADIPF